MPVENLVSVIIPIFDRPEQSQRAIDSVLKQTYRNFELIVVDDCSTTATDEVANLVASNSGKFIRLEENKGVAVARNVGVAHSRGEWVAFLDSDDCWDPEKLQKQIEFIQANPQYEISQCAERWIRDGKFVNQKLAYQKESGDLFFKSLELCAIGPSCVILKKELFEKCGGFDPKLRVCEDYDLWLRICHEHSVGFAEETLVTKYGGHKDQLSHSVVAIDRFRVYSMLKLLRSGGLGVEQSEATLSVLRNKLMILADGAKKRELAGHLEMFQSICEEIETKDFEDSKFQNMMEFLLACY